MVRPEALEVYNTFTWESPGDEKKVDKILEKFEEYCIPRTWQRHILNTRNQCSDETFDQYITYLKTKVKACKFGDLNNGLIRDRIVCGCEIYLII